MVDARPRFRIRSFFPTSPEAPVDRDLQTASLHDMVDRHRRGDRAALDALVRRTNKRLERLAQKMLGDFPTVAARTEFTDVLQSALIRLTRALGEETPNSVRHFYRLAAEQIRRELLDLTRRYRRRPEGALGDADPAAPESANATDLDRWAALQVAVERLPADQREVFGLTFYHGWNQARIAELLQMSDRHVRRLRTEALTHLGAEVGDVPGV